MAVQSSTAKTDYAAVNAIIAIDNPVVRKGLTEALKHAGLTGITEIGQLPDLREALEASVYDLLVVASELGDSFIGPVITELRDGRLNHHPFPLVIVYVTKGAPDHVRQAIDCGPDDLLLFPVVPGQVLARLEILKDRRKPFVVTHDYTGPDRRKEMRPGDEKVPLIEVPNPLKVRVNKLSPEELDAAILRTVVQLAPLKVEAHAVQLAWASAAIATMFAERKFDAPVLKGHLLRLKRIAAELSQRFPAAATPPFVALRGQLAAATDAILRAGPAAEPAAVEALTASANKLAEQIHRVAAEQKEE